jgi:hypothetical protein
MSERVPNWPHTGCSGAGGGGNLLHCSTPDCASQKAFARSLPPAQVRLAAERNGWWVDRKWREAACPAHANEREARKLEVQKTEAAKAGTKKTFAALLEHYDEVAKRYSPGWSDAKVAEAAGMSVDAVAAIRDEHFGPANDPAVDAVLAEVEKLRRDQAELGDLLKAAGERINALASRVSKMQRGVA